MEIKLTQFSKASGCGCKLPPAVLDEILSGCKHDFFSPNLLVGNDTKDDAAVFELADGNCVISTTDFFTPIVDNPFDFGKIAAANAISDVYAMGGNPTIALAILGWPIDKIPTSAAQDVIKGAQEVCALAGIPLAGGHSIETPEPIFGLAVTGLVNKSNIKRNTGIEENDVLYITKPLGIGVLSSALKRELLNEPQYQILLKTTSELNKIGGKLGEMKAVTAMTDVTGFGFVGHLLEMVQGSEFTAEIQKNQLPVLEDAKVFASQFVFPNNTTRNYNDQSAHVSGMEGLDFILFCDPQTSGGLLFSVKEGFEDQVEVLMKNENQFFAKIGKVIAKREKLVEFV